MECYLKKEKKKKKIFNDCIDRKSLKAVRIINIIIQEQIMSLMYIL